MAIFYAQKIQNPLYWLHISSNANGYPLDVMCDLPEQISATGSSEWESRLPYNLVQNFLGNFGAAGEAAGAVIASTGYNNIFQDLSYQMWTDSSPIELQMTVQFDAESSAYTDVWEPLMLLSGLMLPRGGDANGAGGDLMGMLDRNLLLPPGPLNGDSNSDGAVQVRIGRMLTLLDCIMITGTPQWDSRLADDGYPISGQLDLNFRTAKIYGRNDWLAASGVRRA